MSEHSLESVKIICSYAGNLLSAREYSEKMLLEKIEKRFPNALDSEKREVIAFLKQHKYLDERRTAENFLRYRREYSPRGRRMIAQDMYKKKLDPEISAQVLAEFSEAEEAADCLMLGKKKWEMLTRNVEISGLEKRYAIKEKWVRFLAGKGFPYGMIQDAWAEISEESEG